MTHPQVSVYPNKHLIGTYDYSTIHTIVNSSLVCHVSFPPSTDDPFPAILPMIGVMGNFSNPSAPLSSPLDLYLHGYVSSRLMKTASSSTSTSNEDGEGEEGLPVSIAATIVDGIILALTPNNHSYNYRSSILHGYATTLTSIEEKLYALELITNNIVGGRWENSRVPPDKTEMTSTQILKVRIVSASAKVRRGGVHDERKDLKREDVRGRVWTGVVVCVIPYSQFFISFHSFI